MTDSLSEEARQLLVRGALALQPAVRVVQAILDATGEAVAVRTASRRMAEIRADAEQRKQARQQMQDLVDAMKAGNLNAGDMIQALAMQRLEEDPDALMGADPVRVQRLALQGQQLSLKARELEVKGRSLDALERRLALAEERERRAIAAASDEKPAMSAEERIREIREIYGLR